MDITAEKDEIQRIKRVLEELQREGAILLAYLYGSYAKGKAHLRSDIDIAVYLNSQDEDARIEAVDRILMASDKEVEILFLDDGDESPFVIQEALKGRPLIEPDRDKLYELSDRVLHESEGIRFRRETAYEA
ncbi:MAG: nucleotidyltransferase domain-containing protein [Deltaproteobacteria bacterium]|nr:nucleotidyltransferase domain-containing protein [Deltaproteobacteria bacterium]